MPCNDSRARERSCVGRCCLPGQTPLSNQTWNGLGSRHQRFPLLSSLLLSENYPLHQTQASTKIKPVIGALFAFHHLHHLGSIFSPSRFTDCDLVDFDKFYRWQKSTVFCCCLPAGGFGVNCPCFYVHSLSW